MRGRVVVAGAGVVSPAGTGLEEVYGALAAGRPGTGHIRNYDSTLFPSRLGGEVKSRGRVVSHPSGVDRKEVFLSEALGQIAETAAFRAVSPEKRRLYLGVGLDYFDLPGYAERGGEPEGPWQSFSRNSLAAAREAARQHRIGGEVVVNVTACVASSQALGLSLRALRDAPPEGGAIVAGGVDSMLNPLHYMGFHKLGALSTWTGDPAEGCRPFDKDRCGLVLGEGAALFVLMREEDAPEGAALAEIAGYASTSDAYMITDPDPSGASLARAALLALKDAGLTPGDVDCVHLHGTGTRKNDLAEAAAVRLLFPDRHGEIPVFSMKGQVGHLIAGCGAMELVGVLYSLTAQAVPPTVNFREAGPDIPLRVVKDEPLPMEIRVVLKLNAAFGGQNAALVVRRHEP